MKDKTKTTLKIIAIYIIAIAFAGFNVWAVTRIYDDLITIYFAIGGLAATWIFSAVAHETGHLIFAKSAGFRVVKFSVLCFVFDDTKSKKFSLKLNRNDLGECIFIPKKVSETDGDNAQKFTNVALGGLIGSVITIIGYVIAFAFVKNAYGRAFFACFPLPLAVFVINGVKGVIKGSDIDVASVVRSYANTLALDGYLNILCELKNGKTYAEIDEKYFDGKCSLTRVNAALNLFKIRREEELGNYENAISLAEKTLDNGMNDLETKAEIASIGYNAGVSELIEKCGYVAGYLDLSDEPFACRLRLERAKYVGDDKYIEVAKNSALKRCDECYFPGDGKFHKKLIERLL